MMVEVGGRWLSPDSMGGYIRLCIFTWVFGRDTGELGAVRWNHNIELSVDRLRFMNSIVHFDRGIGRKTKVVGVMVLELGNRPVI